MADTGASSRRDFFQRLGVLAAVLAVPRVFIRPPCFVVTVDLMWTVDDDGFRSARPSGRPLHYTLDGRTVSKDEYNRAWCRWFPEMASWAA